MSALAERSALNFEDRMVQYLSEFAPKHFALLGEETIRNIIRSGWDRAKNRELTSERGVQVYLSLMFLFGEGFDTDPQLPWAREILQDQGLVDQSARIDRLYDEAMDYLIQVAGPRNEHLQAALGRIEGDLNAGRKISANSEDDILASLRQIYPEKYDTLAEEHWHEFAKDGIRAAQKNGFVTSRGVFVYVVLMYFLGSGMAADAKYPELATILKEPSETSESGKVENIEKWAKSFLLKWLE